MSNFTFFPFDQTFLFFLLTNSFYPNRYELEDTICHFITNLCGNGQSWLRIWCLKHYHLLSKLESYPVKQMRAFTNMFRKDGPCVVDESDEFLDELPKKLETFDELMKYREKVLDETDANKLNDMLLDICKECNDTLTKEEHSFVWNNDSDAQTIYCYDLEIVDNEFIMGSSERILCETQFWKNHRIFKPFFDQFFGVGRDVTQEVVLTNGEDVYYNVKQGIAFSYDDEEFIVFFIELKAATFSVCRLSFPLKDDKDIVSRTCEMNLVEYNEAMEMVSYYVSTCDGGYEKEREHIYLGSFGKAPEQLSDMFETLGRLLTGITNDDDDSD